MPPLPSIGAREVVTAFEKFGWVVKRQSSSHVILIREHTPITLSVPNHNPVAKGTLRSLIRSANLTIEEFVSVL